MKSRSRDLAPAAVKTIAAASHLISDRNSEENRWPPDRRSTEERRREKRGKAAVSLEKAAGILQMTAGNPRAATESGNVDPYGRREVERFDLCCEIERERQRGMKKREGLSELSYLPLRVFEIQLEYSDGRIGLVLRSDGCGKVENCTGRIHRG